MYGRTKRELGCRPAVYRVHMSPELYLETCLPCSGVLAARSGSTWRDAGPLGPLDCPSCLLNALKEMPVALTSGSFRRNRLNISHGLNVTYKFLRLHVCLMIEDDSHRSLILQHAAQSLNRTSAHDISSQRIGHEKTYNQHLYVHPLRSSVATSQSSILDCRNQRTPAEQTLTQTRNKTNTT